MAITGLPKHAEIAWMKAILLTLVIAFLLFFLYPSMCQLFGPYLNMGTVVSSGSAFMHWKEVLANHYFVQILIALLICAFVFAIYMAVPSSPSTKLANTNEQENVQLLDNIENYYRNYDHYRKRDENYGSKPYGGFVVSSTPIGNWDKRWLKKSTSSKKNSHATPPCGPAKITYNDRAEHHLIVGITGSGKTTNIIQPSIKSIALSEASMIITDPKGELYLQNKKSLVEQGYNVMLLNYEDPSAGITFNQMEFINQEYDKGLPYLYESKALRELIKYVEYLIKDSSDAPTLKRYSMKSEDHEVENPYYDFSVFKSSDIAQDAPLVLSFLEKILTEMVKKSDDVFDSRLSVAEETPRRRPGRDLDGSFVEDAGNEYLHFRQQQVLAKALEVVHNSTKDNIIDFFDKRIAYYKNYIESINNSTVNYSSGATEIENLTKLKQLAIEDKTFSTDVLLSYYRELEKECSSYFTLCEQEAVKQAQNISGMIVEAGHAEGQRGESIWIEAPKALMASLILLTSRESHIPNSRHLSSVQGCLSELSTVVGRNGDTILDTIMACMQPSDAVKLSQTATRLAGDRTKTSIYTSMAPTIQIWADARVAGQSARTAFSFTDVVDKPTAIFLNIPGKDVSPTYTILASLFVEEIYAALVSICNSRPDQHLPRPVYFILEEFGNMPKISQLSSKVSLARSRDIRIEMVVQSLEQLDSNYKSDRQTVVGNCNIVYLLTNDYDTAKYLSDRLGNHQVTTTSSSSSVSDSGSSSSTSQQTQSKPLFAPSELMTNFPENTGLYISPRQSPAMMHFVPSYQMPEFPDVKDSVVFDLNTPRPDSSFSTFIPKDYESFDKAYVSFYGDYLLDNLFYACLLKARVVSE